jgi:chromosome condensin MukBEF ATPase and DNA-binding subunit MukB
MDMVNILALIGAIIGSGGIASFFTLRWTRHSAKFNGMKVEQDTYQELIDDLKTAWKEQKEYIAELHEDRRNLRREKDEQKKQINDLEEKVEKQQTQMSKQQIEIDDLKRIVNTFKPLICSQVGCKTRQSDIIGLISDDSFDSHTGTLS